MSSVRERLTVGQDPLAAFVNLIPSAVVTQALAAAGCVALTRYPPQGRRGWGPFVAHSRWGTELFDYLGQRGGETVSHAKRVILESGIALGGAAPTEEQTRALVKKGYRLFWYQFDVLILKQFVRQTAEWRSVHAPGVSR